MGTSWEQRLPAIAMVSMQVLYAAMALLNRAALVKGMSPRVFIFYRQTIATLVISPIAYFTRRRSNTTTPSIGFKSFVLIFITAFIGVTLNQNMYFEGLYLASSSIASATYNLIPAVTFMTAAAFGLEQVNAKTLSSAAKILGTTFCVAGAVSMTLLRGPKLLNSQLPSSNSAFLHLFAVDQTWFLGCVCLLASSCCWSLWLILQVPVTACYPDHLSLSAWMCFVSMLQTGAVALFLEPDPVAWNLSSGLELTCCFFSGIVGSGVQFFVQSWCISRKGPFYSAMFTPLATVITTVLACIFLHEELYLGSLLGATTVIIGLYVVLWGKSEEVKEKLHLTSGACPVKIDQEKKSEKIDLEQPLLTNDSITPN
ncbi:hypothetical protein SOVF_077790 [Spinacia oleracea]|nr:hypothetical protein SOVF_077790 [Spinacia oleracea]